MLLIVIVGFVSGSPSSSEAVRQNALAAKESSTIAANPLDALSAADIAVQAAQISGLDQEEIVAVRNDANSYKLELALAPAESTIVNKPQLVETDLKSGKDIQTYKVQKGDTVSSVAKKFGITSDSVRWSNNLTGNDLMVGSKLVIPPVNGIAYLVKSGDTIDALAERYGVDKEQLISDNDAELSGLKVGTRILLRGGEEPSPVVRRTSYYSGFAFGGSPIYGYNGYSFGYCTWYVATRRNIPANWGNAYSWDEGARMSGYRVNKTPAPGAILQAESGQHYSIYHVAYVEEVLPDKIRISEMNAPYWGRVTSRWVSMDEIRSAGYDFIH